MRRILFVDDEQRLLDGLGNSLRRFRKQWEMSFACGARAALTLLEQSGPWDVIISDARMPEMDGEALLREVQRRWPDTVRFLFSGQADEGAAHRIVNVAHQFFSKPCESATLHAAVERSCRYRDQISDLALREELTRGGLASASGAATQLATMLADPAARTADVAKSIEQNPLLAARVLQFVSTAFFGQPPPTLRVDSAVSHRGGDTLRALANSLAALEAQAPTAGQGGEPGSRNAAAIVRGLLPAGAAADGAHTACVLVGLGELALLTYRREAWLPLQQAAAGDGALLSQFERAQFGCDHAQVGAYLLSLWGIAEEVVDAVAHHHVEPPASEGSLSVRQCVFVAASAAEPTRNSPPETIEHAGLGTVFATALAIGLGSDWVRAR